MPEPPGMLVQAKLPVHTLRCNLSHHPLWHATRQLVDLGQNDRAVAISSVCVHMWECAGVQYMMLLAWGAFTDGTPVCSTALHMHT